IANPNVAVGGGSGTVTLRLTVTSGANPVCTAATSEVTVTVNPNPTASAGTAPAAQCLSAAATGNTFSLEGSGTNGSLKWTVLSQSSTGLSAVFSNDAIAKPTVTVTGGVSGTVTLRLTVTSGANPVCTAAISDVTVTVNPNPTASAGNAPAAQCFSANGNTFSLNGSGASGTLKWTVLSKTPSTLTASFSDDAIANPNVAVGGGSGTVTLRL
ncbi:hypothetical protein, partial [Hymenobacter antarcticus]|uniref:hypothetical protein n=1 Tax=Hymenobacter antarcticus TaxID=486270 RepID=UPI0031E5477F